MEHSAQTGGLAFILNRLRGSCLTSLARCFSPQIVQRLGLWLRFSTCLWAVLASLDTDHFLWFLHAAIQHSSTSINHILTGSFSFLVSIFPPHVNDVFMSEVSSCCHLHSSKWVERSKLAQAHPELDFWRDGHGGNDEEINDQWMLMMRFHRFIYRFLPGVIFL